MKKFILVVAGLLIAAPAWAAAVHLNSGVTVTGKVVEATSDNIKLDVEGVTVTYYKDEITSIEGDEAAAKALGVSVVSPNEPVAEAPAVPVETAKIAEPAPEKPTVAAAPSLGNPAPVPPAPVVPSAGSSGPLSSDKKEKILKFIDVFGTRETMKLNFEQIMASMPPEEAKKLKDAFNIDDVIQELVPLYDKYFTSEDLDGFIQFYASPTGKKLVQSIPLIMKESVDVSAKYFEEHMPEEMKGGVAPTQP